MIEKTFTFQGLKLTYYDTETPGIPILIAHANGYSAGCYRYYIENLKNQFRVLALDFSGHGKSESTLNFSSWYFFRDQILYLLEKELSPQEKAIGIGHSLGGASMLLSIKKKPNYFLKVIALDPVVLNIHISLLAKLIENPLAKAAKSRRKTFQSIQLIERAYRKFPAFSNWDEEIWKDYLKSCVRSTGNGKEVELCCDPILEAKIFSLSSFRVLFNYYHITGEVHVAIPKKYEVCSPLMGKILTYWNPKSTLEIWEGASHFFPFEWKEKTLQYILNCINK